MALHTYNGASRLHVFEDPIAFPLQFEESDLRQFAIALSVARKSRELPANEEIIRFSSTLGCNWYVYDPFNLDEYFSRVFPQLIQQALTAGQTIHFNLTDIQPYHDTTLRELQYVTQCATALDATTFYEWRDDKYVIIGYDACRAGIAKLLQALDG